MYFKNHLFRKISRKIPGRGWGSATSYLKGFFTETDSIVSASSAWIKSFMREVQEHAATPLVFRFSSAVERVFNPSSSKSAHNERAKIPENHLYIYEKLCMLAGV